MPAMVGAFWFDTPAQAFNSNLPGETWATNPTLKSSLGSLVRRNSPTNDLVIVVDLLEEPVPLVVVIALCFKLTVVLEFELGAPVH